MKNLILSALMLTGVVTFAQETPKKAAKATKTTEVTTDKKAEVTKTTTATQEANGDKKVETSTSVKAVDPAQPAAPVEAVKKTTVTKQ